LLSIVTYDYGTRLNEAAASTTTTTSACIQAVEEQHRAAVRMRMQNAHLNLLSDEEDVMYATAPTTNGNDAIEHGSTQHKREKSKHKDKDKSGDKDIHHEKKSGKREKRGRGEDDGGDGDDAVLAKLQRRRNKPQWQIDEEEYDRQCVAHVLQRMVFHFCFTM
jgi:hypothetical protein